MNAPAPEFIKRCPNCHSVRPANELICLQEIDDKLCHWDLSREPIVSRAQPAPPTDSFPDGQSRTCRNGHPMEPGDELCIVCGADSAGAVSDHQDGQPVVADSEGEDRPGRAEEHVETVIDGWHLFRRLEPIVDAASFRSFLARAESSGQDAQLVLYNHGAEPDRAVFDVLRATPPHHVPKLLATGTHEGCFYEVSELIAGQTLEQAGYIAGDRPELLRQLIKELADALASFAEWGLRHRDLHPGNIRFRSIEPLDLVITGFGSARLSDYDLDAVAPLELTRYSAPETIVGAVSAASDWWSLGMLVLEQATSGRCFEGVNEQAFRLHVVTRGVSIPSELPEDIKGLLRGLLARDPIARWSANQVRQWLAGEIVEAPPTADAEDPDPDVPTIVLAGKPYARPSVFALAAAEAGNWSEARDLSLRGGVATWLESIGADALVISEVRHLASDMSIDEDFRHALILMALNTALPLAMNGEIVTPAWLLNHPDTGYAIITGEIARHLERIGREEWIVRLGARVEAVRERAQLLEVELDEDRLKLSLLASSRASLQAERDAVRQVLPDSDHPGLASILDRTQLSDEDLIILVSAQQSQYVPLASLTDAAAQLAAQVGVQLDQNSASELLIKSRREIFETVDQRIVNFSRCQIEKVDDWADAFRVERRMPLPRAAVLLAVPAEQWKEPPKQQYIKTLLEHFEKRVAGGVSRGPLVRFSIGKTTPRVDLVELGTGARPAEVLLNHVLSRDEAPVPLDPSAYTSNEALGTRLRRLVNHASTFRRDTGLDGRTLGFPFLLIADSGDGPSRSRAKLLPVLLWPVALELQAGGGQRSATLAFDKEREEVRFNPALEGLLGPLKAARWRAARESLLNRASVKMGDVLDAFGGLARPRGRALTRLPSGGSATGASGAFELVPAAALFNAEFTGQSVAADLREISKRSVSESALDALIRVSDVEPASGAPEDANVDSFAVVDSDPSQDLAVLASRSLPGLVVEGPPGTGKSQTIVNIVSDAIGRGEKVLVVCQKQAALQVVKKRLDKEQLTDRLFMVVDLAKDREVIIRELRDQLVEVRDQTGAADARRERDEVLARLRNLEAEIDGQHQALHERDVLSGYSYREILGLLVEARAQGKLLDIPALRTLLGDLDNHALVEVADTGGSLSELWLAAAYEGSALHALKSFSADEALVSEIRRWLEAYRDTEKRRREILAAHANSFDIDDPAPLMSWLSSCREHFTGLEDAERARLAQWLPLFRVSGGGSSSGGDTIDGLKTAIRDLEALDAAHHDDILFGAVVGLAPAGLRERLAEVRIAARPSTFWSRLSPSRWRINRRTRKYLEGMGQIADAQRVVQLMNVLALEERLRPIRDRVAQLRQVLSQQTLAEPLPLSGLLRETRTLLRHVEEVATSAKIVAECPRVADAEQMARAGTLSAFLALAKQFEGAQARHEARQNSLAALARLAPWFPQQWLSEEATTVATRERNEARHRALIEALPTLEAFQRFRLRASALPPLVLKAYAAIAPHSADLRDVLATALPDVVSRTVRYAVYLAWKARLEAQRPALLLERTELNRKVELLEKLVLQLKNANKKVLWFGIDPRALGTATAWEGITRLRGPRAKRLREIIDEGVELGLMNLRPVWLMNPDVASRVLPLKKNLFDLVIYDESSQMLVEHALPTLFRARRVLISGDEKQMPPSAFFSSRIDSDETDDGDLENLEDASTESERAAKVEAWNRREVKDCPDLLQLGRSVLPKSTLQIHYRSKYRELISFSNFAYYQGNLSVPARHPDLEVKRIRPVEVMRVDGVYESQTNLAEAEAVVELLARYWSNGGAAPTLGVVTFNRKQADAIEDAIAARVENDQVFAGAYRRELERTENGEDMGFFVKNVENVQGDERDVMIFSTTFGRDKHGTFRRNFGVLSQTGGERRLNVAVTRAKEKIILVTSMPLSDVSDWLSAGRQARGPRDYLQAYLYYAEQLSGGAVDVARALTQRFAVAPTGGTRGSILVADGFARAVESFIRERGFTPIAASDGDAFGLDYAIEHPRTGLFAIGIECDAPRHPLLRQARAREIWRPGVLNAAIGRVHRVSSYGWFHRPDDEKARLVAAIKAALSEETAS